MVDGVEFHLTGLLSVRGTPFWSHFDVQTIHLPRQAWDKHRETLEKRRLSQGRSRRPRALQSHLQQPWRRREEEEEGGTMEEGVALVVVSVGASSCTSQGIA
jgi:hypothetical protein